MAVPKYWRLGYTGRKRCFGNIKKVNCNARNYAYFFLELESAHGTLYGMQYDNVLLFANDERADYHKYELLANPPLHPKHESSVRSKTGRAPQDIPRQAVAKPVASRPTNAVRSNNDNKRRGMTRLLRIHHPRRKGMKSQISW